MTDLHTILIDIARSPLEDYNAEIHQAINDYRGRSEASAHARQDLKSELGPDDGPESDRG